MAGISNAGVLEHTVFLDRGRGDVDVCAADRAVFVLDAVNRVKAFKNVLDRVVLRVLAGLDGKTLVTEVLKRNDLRADYVLRQLFAGDVTVFRVIRAVNTAVYTVV